MVRIACLTALLVAMATITAHAQRAKVFGVRLGGNFSHLSFKDSMGHNFRGERELIGFHAGVMLDIPISKRVFVQPSLLYSMKGTKFITDAYQYYWNEHYTNADYLKLVTNTIEIPVNLVYKIPAGPKGKLVLGAGGYMNWALNGFWEEVINWDLEYGDLDLVNDMRNKSADTTAIQITKGDHGLSFLAGYEFSPRFSVQLNKQFGLVNRVPTDDGREPKDSWKNGAIMISAVFKLF